MIKKEKTLTSQLHTIMDLDGDVTTKNFKFKSDVGFYGE